MFLNDSARVKMLLLVLMSEIKNQSYSGKKIIFFCCSTYSLGITIPAVGLVCLASDA